MATKPLETIDAMELRQIHGGAARAERKQNVAFAMNAMASKGSVSNWQGRDGDQARRLYVRVRVRAAELPV